MHIILDGGAYPVACTSTVPSTVVFTGVVMNSAGKFVGVFWGDMARNMEFEPLVSILMRATRPGRVAGSRSAVKPTRSSCPGKVAKLRGSQT